MAKSKELKTVVSFAGKVDPSLAASALKAGKKLQKAQQRGLAVSKGIGKATIGALKAIGTTLIATATIIGTAFGGIATQGLALASDLQEVQNVVNTTFEQGAGVIDEFAQSALNSFGVSELNAKQFTGTLGAMFKSMNVGDEQMSTMSQNLTALSGDMASFYNLDTTEAFEKIRAGISGETEPLKQLGINMSVANLEDFATAQGESKKFADMSQAEQAMLRYGYLMQVTADAQGDFAKTSGGYANQQRLMGENFKQISGRIMEGFLPAIASVMKVLNDFMAGLDIAPFQALAETAGEIVTGMLPMIQKLLPTMVTLLGKIAPHFLKLLEALLPLATNIFPLIGNLLAKVMPVVVQLVNTLMPVIEILLTAFCDALGPLMPIIQDLLVALSPILKVVAVVIGFVVDLAAALLGGVIKAISMVFSLFTSQAKTMSDASKETMHKVAEGKLKKKSMDEFANGGFASRASIFGEAGLEAAIPIRPGDPHSLALLAKTARMLGVAGMQTAVSLQAPAQVNPIIGTNSTTYVLEYKPQIHGDAASVEPILKQGYLQMKQMFEELIDGRERVCYE